jgi:beta-galactosidase
MMTELSAPVPEPTRPDPVPVLLSAAYYREYQPYDRLDADLDLMRAAHFTAIRVGESVWATWEPSDGVFRLDWLGAVLDGAYRREIRVILGTPTYAVPPWLARKYPEIMAQRRSGQPIPYGHRQNVDYSHPGFRFHAERVIRRIVSSYAQHPAVIGYQLDNEPGLELLHNPGVADGFREYLRREYGDVAEVNRRWGLAYWSQQLSDWQDLWPEDGNTNPGYALAWRRYQAEITADFIRWQASIVREYARPGQFVTTCFAYRRPAVRPAALARSLDIAAVNIYYASQAALGLDEHETAPPPPFSSRESGPWWVAFEADFARGLTGRRFLVTETNASSIGESHYNYPAFDGQRRQVAWLLVSRGAAMVGYWHWHTLHYGHEMYWGGVLGHDLRPGRTYEELQKVGNELRLAGAAIDGLEPDVDIALLHSDESRWAMEFSPPLARDGTTQPDRDSYDEIFGRFYRGCFDAGLQTKILDIGDLAAVRAARTPVLVVPALYVASDDVLEALRGYAAEGGHLVLTFRCGYVDEHVQARHETMPGALRDAVGAWYQEYTNLPVPVPLTGAADEGADLGEAPQAVAWADSLVLEGAVALARYGGGPFAGGPAITTHSYQRGRVTYVGTLLDPPAMRRLMAWLIPASASAAWRGLPAGVTVGGARNSAGRNVSFLWNWSARETVVTAPGKLWDCVSATTYPEGAELTLGPWDVRVLLQDK